MILNIEQLDRDLPLPSYAREGDAGLDLYSTVDLELTPGTRYIVPTGIAIAIPSGYCGLVIPRSGLAARHGITVVNAPGLIDSGYRGEIKVIVLNTDHDYSHRILRGDRIAQLVIKQFESITWNVVRELDETDRVGGFGHTGR